MKKGWIVFGVIFGILLVTANVSAGIYFSQLDSIYNLGDRINLTVGIDPVQEGYLKVNLVCGDNSINIFNGVPSGSQSMELPLTYIYIQNTLGKCYFLGNYFGSEQKSQVFEISNKLDVSLDYDTFTAKPSDEVVISGTSKRKNGVGINGAIDVSIPLMKQILQSSSDNSSSDNQTNDSSVSDNSTETTDNGDGLNFHDRVSDGKFEISFNLADDTPAGDYQININTYEEDFVGRKTSTGSDSANLKILQVLKNVDLAINDQNIDPGKDFSFKPMLLDQSGVQMIDDISVIITDEAGNRVYQEVVTAGQTYDFSIPTNLTSGYYNIDASSGDLNISKNFFINEKAIVNFTLVNGTLTVANIGNIPYDKDIQVQINGKPFLKRVSIGLGEQKDYTLTGDGNYDVLVSDGETNMTQSGISLLGGVVGVQDSGTGSLLLSTPIIWIFFIVIIGGGLLFVFRDVLKRKSYAFKNDMQFRKSTKSSVDLTNSEPQKTVSEEKNFFKQVVLAPQEAVQGLVSDGRKDIATVICIRIKNTLTKDAKKQLRESMSAATSRKGALYESGDDIFAIFSPLATKKDKNDVEAVRAAELIRDSLNDYNEKFNDKIEFGIGVGTGEIIDKIENKKLMFTALGGLIISIKKNAQNSKGEVLLTRSTYEKSMNEVKSEKKGATGNESYEVKRVVDKEKNQKFINDFLKRTNEDSIKRASKDPPKYSGQGM